MAIPFVDVKAQFARVKTDMDARIAAVMDHCKFILGPEVVELEGQLAQFAGVDHCISVSSGTDALLIVLMAEGVGPGDAVFLPTFTYTATAEVVLLLGAHPIFVDVDPDTYNIDPEHLLAQIKSVRTAGKLRPKAIIAVDLFGLPADFARIGAIAAAENLVLLDDAAQGFGGAIGNQRIGAVAPYTATSFFPAKPLGCAGDGGAIFCHDADKAALMRSIRFHGVGSDPYDVQRVGLNGRLDTLQAAILLSKLTIFEAELAEREALSRIYDQRLKGIVPTPARPAGLHYAWAIYTIRVQNRDKLRKYLTDQGVPTAVYYPKPMHFQTAYQAYGDGPGSCPVAERLSGEVMSLPMHPYIDEATAHFICDQVIAGTKL